MWCIRKRSDGSGRCRSTPGRSVSWSVKVKNLLVRTHRARSGCSGSAYTLYASWSSGRETLTSGELSLDVLDLSGLDQVER